MKLTLRELKQIIFEELAAEEEGQSPSSSPPQESEVSVPSVHESGMDGNELASRLEKEYKSLEQCIREAAGHLENMLALTEDSTNLPVAYKQKMTHRTKDLIANLSLWLAPFRGHLSSIRILVSKTPRPGKKL